MYEDDIIHGYNNSVNNYEKELRLNYPSHRPYSDNTLMNCRQNTTGYSYQNYYEYKNYYSDERLYRSSYQRRSLRGNRNFNVHRRRNNYIRPARVYDKYEKTSTAVISSKAKGSVCEEENTNKHDKLSCDREFEDINDTPAQETEDFNLDLSDAETVHLEDEEDNSPETNSATRIEESTNEDLNHNRIDYSKDNTTATSDSYMFPHKKQSILSETTMSENVKGASVNGKSSSRSIDNDQKKCVNVNVKSSSRSIENEQKNNLSKYANKSLEKTTNEKVFKNIASPSSKENIRMKSQSCVQRYKDVHNQKPLPDTINTAKCEFRERDGKLMSSCNSSNVRKSSKGNESGKPIEQKPKSMASTVLDMPSVANNSIIVKINRDVLKSGIISEKCGKADEFKAIRKDIYKKNIENKKSDNAVNGSDVLNNKSAKKDANIYAKVYKERIRDHKDFERKGGKDEKTNSKQKQAKLSNNSDKHDKNNEVKRSERSCDKESEMRSGKVTNENSKSIKSMCIEDKSLRPSNEVLTKCNQRVYLNENKQVFVTKQIATPTHETRASSSLLNDEGIKLLDKTLATLECDNGLNSVLNDKEVEEIMSKEPVKDVANSRRRGKSCIPLQQEQCETRSNLVRSKSLQGKDFLCYTPFRITRSMSRNWLLSPGIPNGNVRETFNKLTPAKRRQSIDVCKPVTEKPSLFSAQTTYMKPAEIEFTFTPRHNDDFPENITETSNVTVIYRDNNPTDPRKTSGSTKIKYNGRELIKYNDLVKENIPTQRTRVHSKEGAPAKIGARRKSSVKNDDPDYVPHCKIVCSPRCNEPPIKNHEGEGVSQKNIAVPKLLTPFKRKSANATEIEAADKKKSKERACGLSMPILEDTTTNISPKRTISEPSISKELKLSKQKHSDEYVAYVPHATKEVCVPFTVKKPRMVNAVASIEVDIPVFDVTAQVTAASVPEQVQNANSEKNSISNSLEELRRTFERLGDYFFVIKALDCNRAYHQAYFHAMPIPSDVRDAEIGHFSILFQERLGHYLRKVHIICEAIDWKRVSPDFFVNMLASAVRDRRPAFKYDSFLNLLALIMRKCVTVGASYAVKMLTYIQYITELYKRNAATASNVCTNQNIRDQEKATAKVLASNNKQPRPAPQQQQRVLQNSNAVPSTQTSLIMTPAQRLQLQQQIIRYNQLMQNYRTIAPRAPAQKPPPQAAKGVNATTPQASWSINLRSLLDSQLPLRRGCMKHPCCTVPTHSGSVSKNNIPPNPTRNDSSGSTATFGGSFPCSKIETNKLANSACTPSLQSCESLPGKQAVPTIDLSSVNTSTNSTEADLVPPGGGTQEFVDFECYFANNDNADMTVVKKVEECGSSSDAIPAKRRRLSDVEIIGEDPPPRNPSNDSGVDSPHLNEKDENPFAHYENRVCHCGEPAVYLCPCGSIMYCSTDCQLVDWPTHKNSTEHKTEK